MTKMTDLAFSHKTYRPINIKPIKTSIFNCNTVTTVTPRKSNIHNLRQTNTFHILSKKIFQIIRKPQSRHRIFAPEITTTDHSKTAKTYRPTNALPTPT